MSFLQKGFQEKAQIKKIPKVVIGIYFLIQNDIVVYVGKSTDIETRLTAHRKGKKEFDSYAIMQCNIEWIDLMETFFISKYQPIYNNQFSPCGYWDLISKDDLKKTEVKLLENRALNTIGMCLASTNCYRLKEEFYPIIEPFLESEI